MEIDLNMSVRNNHVPEIERLNKTMKERIRSVYTEFIRVYGHVSNVLVRKLVYALKLWINSFHAKDGISATLIPRDMITGQFVDFTKHCLLEFGEYVHTYEYGDNSMESQILEALAFRPTRNIQGSHYFLNLHTGRIIACFAWTALPVPTLICKLVRRLVRRYPVALEVLDRLQHEVPYADSKNNGASEDYVPGEDDDNNNNDDDDGDIVGYNYIDPHQEPADINTNENYDAAIILND